MNTWAAENTLEAFRAAQRLGADAIELDVRLSTDGSAVVYHYAYLEALTDGAGPVWQRSLAELRALRVGRHVAVRIPTLEEVLDEFGPTPLEAWMGLDVIAHLALHRARQAGAGAVLLHPTQLSEAVVNRIRAGGLDVHAWDVNTVADLELAVALELSVACTDHPEQALRRRASQQRRL